MNIDLLNDDVLETLSNRFDLDLGEEKDCERMKNRLKNMSAREVLDEYLGWHGIIGYTNIIVDTYEHLKEVEEACKEKK